MRSSEGVVRMKGREQANNGDGELALPYDYSMKIGATRADGAKGWRRKESASESPPLPFGPWVPGWAGRRDWGDAWARWRASWR